VQSEESDSPAHLEDMSIGPEAKLQTETANGVRDRETASSAEASTSKKPRGHLHVPSRSSSQKNQPSPTTTGLSGVTASDSRDSIGRTSKESKRSMLGRRRPGSASSHHSGMVTQPTSTTGTSQPNSPANAPARRKKGGLLSLLGCCGVPDNANALDGGEDPLPSHKLDKIPQRQLTSSRRTVTPSDHTSGSKTQVSEKEKEKEKEKEPLGQTESALDTSKPAKRVSGSTAQDQPMLGDRDNESKGTTLVTPSGPSIKVNAPVAEDHELTNGGAAPAPAKDTDGDVPMADVDTDAQQAAPAVEEQYQPTPAPAVPVPNANPPVSEEDTAVALAPSEPEQKWLLPPIQPHLKGRKCLVLDLDETLVHSSFKVSSPVFSLL
jgi:carboxy-terminal domain RNA polymerase II polypeptide A small phosphatase